MTEREPPYLGVALAAALVAAVVTAMVVVLEPRADAAYVLFWALIWTVVAGIPFVVGFYVRGSGYRLAGVVAYGTVALLWFLRPAAGEGSEGFLPGLAEGLFLLAWTSAGIAAIVGAVAGSVTGRVASRRSLADRDPFAP